MNGELWAGIAGAFLTFMAALIAWPKVRAEARKANAQADDSIVARLTREIKRLDEEMATLRNEVVEVKKTAIDEKRELEKDNKALRDRVSSLEASLAEERDECAKKLHKMEGHIRQLQQRQASYANITEKPLSGELNIAFPVGTDDKDADLIDKLKHVPAPKPTKRGRR